MRQNFLIFPAILAVLTAFWTLSGRGWTSHEDESSASEPLLLIPYGEARHLADLADENIDESSGIAVSRRHAGVFWTHNDSGDDPRIYAFDRQGKSLGSVLIQGATAIDWEDMASFELEGVSYLLLADVGDNGRRRKSYSIYIVEEPPLAARVVAPRHTLEFRYEDGAHDCEAVGVDVRGGSILLVAKLLGMKCPVYRLPLRLERGRSQHTAVAVGTLNLLLATAMDISPDGKRALVATYLDAHEYHRREDESWPDAFQRRGRLIMLPERQQGEAACYGSDGETIYLTSEKLPTPLWEVGRVLAAE